VKAEGSSFSYWKGRRREKAASKSTNQDLIIINKYYNKLTYFHNGYIEIVDSVATGKTLVKIKCKWHVRRYIRHLWQEQ